MKETLGGVPFVCKIWDIMHCRMHCQGALERSAFINGVCGVCYGIDIWVVDSFVWLSCSL
jgi:hypothetical protein